MQKLVIEYYSGDEFEAYPWIECVEYDSPEAFYVDFENICKETFYKYHDISKKIAEMSSYKERLEYFKTNGCIKIEFIFCGISWISNNFFYKDKEVSKTNKDIKLIYRYRPPDITELNKWFEDKISDNIKI
jgi:hypothetical protein